MSIFDAHPELTEALRVFCYWLVCTEKVSGLLKEDVPDVCDEFEVGIGEWAEQMNTW